MKLVSGFFRLLNNMIGWMFVIVFGGVGVYALLDDTMDEPGLVAFCFLLAGAGALLIRSAWRDKRRREAQDEEEKQYRRRQEEETRERAAREERRTREARQDSVAWTTVECPGCGAVAKVRRGGVSRCEYCDTPLKGE